MLAGQVGRLAGVVVEVNEIPAKAFDFKRRRIESAPGLNEESRALSYC